MYIKSLISVSFTVSCFEVGCTGIHRSQVLSLSVSVLVTHQHYRHTCFSVPPIFWESNPSNYSDNNIYCLACYQIVYCYIIAHKIPRILWNPKVHYSFTRVRHLSLSWARLIQSMPLHTTFRRSVLILSYHLLLGIPSGLFLSGFPTKTL
jgi:hypothetical protein